MLYKCYLFIFCYLKQFLVHFYRVEEAAKKKKKVAETEQSVSSEEDSESLLPSKPDTADLPLPELPNLFKKRHFFLYGELSSKTRHDLQRYITAYNGYALFKMFGHSFQI